MLLYCLADQSEASPKMAQFWLVDRLNVLWVSDPGKHQYKFCTTCQYCNNIECQLTQLSIIWFCCLPMETVLARLNNFVMSWRIPGQHKHSKSKHTEGWSFCRKGKDSARWQKCMSYFFFFQELFLTTDESQLFSNESDNQTASLNFIQ